MFSHFRASFIRSFSSFRPSLSRSFSSSSSSLLSFRSSITTALITSIGTGYVIASCSSPSNDNSSSSSSSSSDCISPATSSKGISLISNHPHPTLPSDAPEWLHSLFDDESFSYHDMKRHFDPSYHLLYGSLHRKDGIEHYYLFVEKPPTTTTQKKSNELLSSQSNPASSSSEIVLTPHDSSSHPSLNPSSASDKFFSPKVFAVFKVGKGLCGHQKIVHGGLTAALMDDISGAAVVAAYGPGIFTVNLNIDYKSPIPVNSFVLVRGHAQKVEGRKCYVNVLVEDGNGHVYAKGSALFVKPKQGAAKIIAAATEKK